MKLDRYFCNQIAFTMMIKPSVLYPGADQYEVQILYGFHRITYNTLSVSCIYYKIQFKFFVTV